ncbi:hypothetical protein [Agromyces seonyuensis]|nr:hypothetical protein [Agromyces seonyuensis]
MSEMMNATMADEGMTMMAEMDSAMMMRMTEAMSACMQACLMCADADGGEGMARCAAMCANCADMCQTMMRMLLRPSGMDMMVMSSMANSVMVMCRACSAECMMHADEHEHCRMCAMACDEAAMACEEMLAAMKMMG